MFERDKSNNEIKSFDIDLSTNSTNDTDKENGSKVKSKKSFLIGVAVIALLSGGGLLYSKLSEQSSDHAAQGASETKTMFVPMDEITVNLRQGVENKSAWLKIKVTLEVTGKTNYDMVTQMTPKIMDIFQTYLKELKKTDLDGSFGIYKIKDEMLLRINTILYPGKIEAILFQDFMMQVL